VSPFVIRAASGTNVSARFHASLDLVTPATGDAPGGSRRFRSMSRGKAGPSEWAPKRRRVCRSMGERSAGVRRAIGGRRVVDLGTIDLHVSGAHGRQRVAGRLDFARGALRDQDELIGSERVFV